MILCLNYGHIFENFTYWQNLGSDLMRIIFLVIFALWIIIPIGVNDAFAADGSVKLTVEINDSTASGLDLENRDFFGVSVVNIGA